jgi:exopolyphosphatase/guanosine-5'-triphosphate,3'-diphosphate pyrophosphatase
VFREFALTARSLGVPPERVLAVATSAARRAEDAPSLFGIVERETGLRVRIIQGEEEARLTWAGAFAGLPDPTGNRAVVDLGGGSTEIATGDSRQLSSRISLELGSVRLTESFLEGGVSPANPSQLQHLDEQVTRALAPLDSLPAPDLLVAVAGTATTLCAMDAGLDHWNREKVHGRPLSIDALWTWRARLARADLAERRLLASVSPERAPFLVAGATVLARICSRLGLNELVASDGGVRHGLLARHSANS